MLVTVSGRAAVPTNELDAAAKNASAFNGFSTRFAKSTQLSDLYRSKRDGRTFMSVYGGAERGRIAMVDGHDWSPKFRQATTRATGWPTCSPQARRRRRVS